MSRWFRHYAGMMRDEKLVSAAVRSKQPVERVIWVWGAILESASEEQDGGRFSLDPGEAAYFLRCESGDISGILAALEASGRICQGVVARWSERQFESDSSKERTARYRQRKAEIDVSERSERHSGNSDAAVTSRDADVTPPETETETETEKNITHNPREDDPEREVFDLWNTFAPTVGLKPLRDFSLARRKKIAARTAEMGGQGAWPELLQIIRQSPHLLGKTPPKAGENPWFCTFDWLLEPRNLTKVREGNYVKIPVEQHHGPTAGRFRGQRPGTIADGFAAVDAVIDEIERREQASGQDHRRNDFAEVS